MFGKAWRFQAIDLEMFGLNLEKLAGRKGEPEGAVRGDERL
jgi:hypothetical protein